MVRRLLALLLMFCGFGGVVQASAARPGSVLREFRTGGQIWGSLTHDAATGRQKWSFEPRPLTGYVTGGVTGSPVIEGGVAYVGALDGRIYALKE